MNLEHDKWSDAFGVKPKDKSRQKHHRELNEETPLIGVLTGQGAWSPWMTWKNPRDPMSQDSYREESGLAGIHSLNNAGDRRSRSPLSSVMLFLGILFFVSACAAIALSSSKNFTGPTSIAEKDSTQTAELLADARASSAAPVSTSALLFSASSSSSSSPSINSSPLGPISISSSTKVTTVDPFSFPATSRSLALGVCWAPKHNMSSPADILADALLIRRHFRQVRTFYSAYYQTPVMPYFVQAGLKAVLGVFMYPDEPSWTEAEKRVAVQSAISFPSHTVAIYVGNENVAPYGNYSVDELIRHMQDVREGLREKGVQVPVGTVQRLTEWLREKDEMDRLAEASDLLGVNFYPYFSIDGESLEAQWEKMVKRYPNHMQKIRVTETGWPSAGSPNFANRTASHAQAEAYYQTYVKWACEQRRRIEGEEEKGGGAETFYYAYFDGRAPSTAPDYEAHFGLVTEDGNKPKFELEDGFCPGEKELLQEKDDKTF